MRIGLSIVMGTMLALSASASAQTVPVAGSAEIAIGYSEEQIAPDHFVIRFGGEHVTDVDKVEQYLLYRAAQLARSRGYENVTIVSRNPDERTARYAARCADCAYWREFRPYWRWTGAKGLRTYDPYSDYPDPAHSGEAYASKRYEASAEIILTHDPRTFHSREFNVQMVIEERGLNKEAPE